MAGRIGKTLKTASRLVATCLLLIGGYLGYVQLTDNFAPVVAGEVFRSAQLSRGSLQDYVHREGIRSIINLRGENAGKPWYDEEISAAKELGIQHVDFRMSARRELDQSQVEQLITLMDEAPKPVLIHCKAGADRTGLASALYVAAIAKHGEDAAERQLSIYYGHLSLPFIPEFAMDRTFEAMEPWLGFSGS